MTSPTLAQALLIGLTYFLANSAFLGGLSYFTVWRPLLNGLIVGVILGDPVAGAMTGAALNIMYLGNVSAGGTLGFGDGALAGILGSTIGIASGSTGLGILSGVLLGQAGFQLLTWRMQVDDRIAARIEAAAARGDVARMQLWHIGVAQAWLFVITVLPAALLAGLCPIVLRMLLQLLPAAIGNGLALGGTLALMLGLALATQPMQWRLVAGGLVLGTAARMLGRADMLWTLLFATLSFHVLFTLLKLRTPGRRPTANTPLLPFVLWQFFSHSNYSMARLQGSGLGSALAPALRAKGAAAIQRHLGFFNTEVNFGALIPAALLRMEQRDAAPGEIDATRAMLMGTVAGFGDAATQGALLPALLCGGIGLTLSGNATGWAQIAPWVCALALAATLLLISWRCYHAGWSMEKAGALWLLSDAGLARMIRVARASVSLGVGLLLTTPRLYALPAWPPLANTLLLLGLLAVCHALVRRAQIKPGWVLAGLVALGFLMV